MIYKEPDLDWATQGGCEDPDIDRVIEEDDGKTFFYQFWYDENRARFEDVPTEAKEEAYQSWKYCPGCVRQQAKKLVS